MVDEELRRSAAIFDPVLKEDTGPVVALVFVDSISLVNFV